MATKQNKNKKDAPVKPAANHKPTNKKKGGKDKQSGGFSEQFMPYILGALGFVFALFFIMNAVSYGKTPDEHLIGPIGYGFCKFFFGLFGWAAFLIPVLFFYLTAFWRKNCRENTVILRVVLSAVLMVLLSSVVHVFVCSGDEAMAVLDIPMLFETGAVYQSGGVVGGIIGLGLYLGLKPVGTIIVSVVVFPLLVMLLVGVTPAYVAEKIKEMSGDGSGKRSKAPKKKKGDQLEDKSRRTPKRTVAEDEDDAYDDSDDSDDRDDSDDSDGDQDDGDDGYVTPRRSTRRDDRDSRDSSNRDKKDGKRVAVDTETGEVLDEDDEDDDNGVAPVPPRPPRRVYTAEDTVGEDDRKDGKEHTDNGAEDGDGGDSSSGEFYMPARRRNQGDRKDRRDDRGAVEDEDGFFSDDDHHGTETVEVDLEGEDDLHIPPRRPVGDDDRRDHDREKMVVLIREQDRTPVHNTVDNQVDGLADEEIVLPSGTGEASAEEKSEYSFPPIDLLTKGSDRYEADEEEIARNTETLREVLESFHIRVKEVACSCGPTITRFEVKPDQGVRVRSIANLVDDIALGLAKSGVRIDAPIPGKAAVGIEVPTEHPATVYLRNLIESPEFRNHKSRIAACLGADVSGRPVIFDINKMPHLLVAGATGMGKSVCINSIIMSILYKATPDEVKLILIDPKKVEFTMYRDLPHLYAPIVSDPKKAAGCLNSAVNEMERRFELIEEEGVRNIAGYNEVIADDPTKQPMPRIVIIIDEFADLMMTASQEVETAVCRLAQKARAAGIHIIIGTQRPSVDVITGLIKANIPSRIAFTVASSRDSMTILDMGGAEKLIGRGDMLYAPVGASKPMRVQGTFVSDGEVERVVTYIKENNNRVAFDENFVKDIELEAAKCGAGKKKGGDMAAGDFDALGGGDDSDEKMFWAAVEVAVEDKQISTSLLQRRLRIGFGKASRYIDRMEEMGFVTAKDGAKPRKTLITPQDLAEIRVSGRTETPPAE